MLLISTGGCAFKSVNRSKNITYTTASQVGIAAQQLNVFAPAKHKSLNEVLIFIHGGSWNSGKKSMYNFFGNRLARKGVVTVIIDYPLSPNATYKEMAKASAAAVIWVQENIYRYGGDLNRIFISGHSAGGHLAALLAVQNQYLGGKNNPLKGAVLIDAAGLDMYSYLQEENFEEGNTYLKTFTVNPANWKDASPLYHIHNGMPPMLIYCGGKTYPSIRTGNDKFVAALKTTNQKATYRILNNKKHVPMITQFLYTGNPRYKEIINFMRQQK